MSAHQSHRASAEIGRGPNEGTVGGIMAQGTERDHRHIAQRYTGEERQRPTSRDGCPRRTPKRPPMSIESEGSAVPPRRRSPSVVGSRRGVVAHAVGQCVIGLHCVAEVTGHLLCRARASSIRGPHLLHDEHVGIELGALCAHVIGAAPSVHPEVNVEGGKGQRLHGQPRTAGLTGAGGVAAAGERASERRARESPSVSPVPPRPMRKSCTTGCQ